jgi:hypothetical protein
MRSRTSLETLDKTLPPLLPLDNGSHLADALASLSGQTGSINAGAGSLGAGSSSGEGETTRIRLDTIWRALSDDWRHRICDPPLPGARSESLARIYRHLYNKGLAAPEIELLLQRFPEGPVSKFAGRKDLGRDIARVLDKMQRREAHRTKTKEAVSGKPIIDLIEGELPEIVNEAEKHLIAGDPDVYQRGDVIVRPGVSEILTVEGNIVISALTTIGVDELVERFTKVVAFRRYDKRSEDYEYKDCPERIAKTYYARSRRWKLRKLRVVVDRPYLREDGSIVETPGFAPETGILFDPRGQKFPPVPKDVRWEDGFEALKRIHERLFREYAFASSEGSYEYELCDDWAPSASRSVTFSGLLSSTARLLLPTVPLHAFSSREAGSGKSKIVDAASIIICGHPAPVFGVGPDAEEFEKRLGVALMNGYQLVSFDNCSEAIDHDALAQCLSQPIVSVRVLGYSEVRTCPNVAVFFVTGNNLIISGDLPRRTLRCLIDPQIERPSRREFDFDPVVVARQSRGELLRDVHIVWRAFLLASAPKQNKEPLGSFEAWDKVRDLLIWYGQVDPCQTMEDIRDEDPGLLALRSIVDLWAKYLGYDPVTAQQIIARATWQPGQSSHGLLFGAAKPYELEAPDFREAWLGVAGRNGSINSQRLGKWLGRNKGRVINGHRIMPAAHAYGIMQWQLQRIDAHGRAIMHQV